MILKQRLLAFVFACEYSAELDAPACQYWPHDEPALLDLPEPLRCWTLGLFRQGYRDKGWRSQCVSNDRHPVDFLFAPSSSRCCDE